MTDHNDASGGSWWSSLPGILTAIAGIITALTGLIVALHQIGFFSPGNKVLDNGARVKPPVSVVAVVENRIAADNSVVRLGERLWQWTIFIKAPEKLLDEVQYVEYTLHPSYKDSVVTVYERATGSRAFPLTRTAWGTFRVYIKVVMRDGSTRQLSHYLKFH